MSVKAAAGGSGTIAGLNIMATGISQNYFLDTIPPNNLFLMKNVVNILITLVLLQQVNQMLE